jgi:hypothetical protein
MHQRACRLQRAELGSSVTPPAAPQPYAEEAMCVVCFDAPKDHIIVPCGHQCAEQLTKTISRERRAPCAAPTSGRHQGVLLIAR